MFIGDTMVIKGILLAHIESNLGEKPGIPPPKKKKNPKQVQIMECSEREGQIVTRD